MAVVEPVPVFLMLPLVDATELRILKGRYDLARFEIGKQERKATEALNVKYGTALQGLRTTLRKEANLDAVIIIDEELKRFADVPNVGDDVGESKIPRMNELFAIYRKERQSIALAAARKRLELANGFYKTLNAEEVRLVKAKDMDSARRVRAEKEALVANTELARAKRLVAESVSAAEKARAEAAAPATPVGSAVRIAPLPSYLKKGLQIHLTFNQADTRLVVDESAQAYKAKVHGAKISRDGKVGNALELGGGSDRAGVPHADALTFPDEATVAAWVYLRGWDSGGSIVSKGTGGGNESLMIDIAGDEFRFVRWNAQKNKYVQAVSATRPKKGVWQHVAAVTDGKRMRIYVDGKVTSGSAITEPLLLNTEPLRFGARWGKDGKSDYRALKGLIDEVMVYDRALSEKEVNALMRWANKS